MLSWLQLDCTYLERFAFSCSVCYHSVQHTYKDPVRCTKINYEDDNFVISHFTVLHAFDAIQPALPHLLLGVSCPRRLVQRTAFNVWSGWHT